MRPEGGAAHSSPASSGAKVPLDVDDFAATCKALREEVLAEVDAGRLNGVAQGMQLAVAIQRTDEGASGLFEGATPHDLDRFGGKNSHH